MGFHSILWRLVSTYVLLTVLVVSLVGVVAVALVKQHAQQQEIEYLTANANVVAHQVMPLLGPLNLPFALQDLAMTASFLGNTRVKILAHDHTLLADSGPRAAVDHLVWIRRPVSSGGMLAAPAQELLVVPAPAGAPGQLLSPDMLGFVQELPPGTTVGMASRHSGAWGSRFTLEWEAAVDQLPATPAVDQTSAEEPPRSAQSVKVPVGDPAAPLGYVELSDGPNVGAATLTTTYQSFGLAAAIAAAAALIVSLLVSRRITAPVYALTAAAGQMSAGDLSTRARISTRDEIGRLAQQFNQMAARLETSFAEVAAERDTLRRFIADASHELRTPITALRTFNELLQTRTEQDPAAQTEFLRESQVQITRMEAITHHLLDLSRLDGGLAAQQFALHPADEILEGLLATFSPVAREHRIDLRLVPPIPDVQLCCDRTWLEMALSNVVDNALKFTPAGGAVQIDAQVVESMLRMTVTDSGIGIAEADLPHVFERFYRGQHQHIPGSGLGLAIVAGVVQSHHGQVRLINQPGGGCQVIMELPIEQEIGIRNWQFEIRKNSVHIRD